MFLLFVLLFLQGCGGPGWYVAREVVAPESFLVGYGEGETLAAARADAAREIAEALGVRVRSTGEMVMEGGEDGVKGFSRFHVSLDSRATLNDLALMKQGQASGRYYVALGYDNRTLFQKVEAGRGRFTGPAVAQGAGFKGSLPASRSLARLGISPWEYRVARRHGGWALAIDEAVYPIPPQEWYRFFFAEKTENRGLRLEVTPPGPLHSGSRYQVLVTPLSATGCLSLYHVTEGGQVLALITNQPVTSPEPIVFPDPSLYDGLEAIAPGEKGTRDMLLATWTPVPMPASVFHGPVTETPLAENDERTFSYGDLLENLNEAFWASRFVWIESR